ncbi:MAG: FAD binding domain-containing protein [Spirochaetales bacterium]|uniref:FAD binding domain-containing protein n=1 Tax=Candidatus Thalassospirochaeta sargassi TaxID=3119039 RepID=A0AAJ1MJZ9_9SPIO|nr:FAD binding domain-containing protein [Spirochaetales bacterium]
MSDKLFSAGTLLPATIEEASSLIMQGFFPVGGGTDIMVRNHAMKKTGGRVKSPLFSCRRIEETTGIHTNGNILSIGSSCTLSSIIESSLCPAILAESLLSIASPGIRNIATLAGNICNASPAADSLPVLYILDAMIETAGSSGRRSIPVKEFITAPGTTSLKDDEIVVSVSFDSSICHDDAFRWYFRKVGTRAANALSKLSIAACTLVDNGIYSNFRLAVGACAPAVVRLSEAEDEINGKALDKGSELAERVIPVYTKALNPIDDQRSTSDYRRNTALKLIANLLSEGF